MFETLNLARPTRMPPGGVVVLEALLSGTPVIRDKTVHVLGEVELGQKQTSRVK